MPSIDLPAAVRTADKIMVTDYHTDRIRLVVRYVVAAGYYATDEAGKPVPNGLGNATFVPTTILGEYLAPLPAPETMALIAAREPEAQAAMDVHPPAIAYVDDYYSQLCLDHYQATVLNPAPAQEIPAMVLPEVLP